MFNNDIPAPGGALESPKDYRDEIAMAFAGELEARATPALPAEFHEDLGPVYHQRKTPSCVSQSVATLVRQYHFYKTGEWLDFSPRFLDALAKQYDGLGPDDGAYPRMVMSLAAKYGCATTATCPNDTSLSNAQYRSKACLTPAAYAEASKYRIPGYVRVQTDPGAIRQAIYFYGAVSALFRIGEELWIPGWEAEHTDPLRTPNTVVSGHQMTPNGWSDGTFNWLRNSWGTTWAVNGETRYDQSAWDKYMVEAWAVAELPEDLKAYMSNLPKPADFHYSFEKNLKRGDVNEDVKMAQIALMILGFMTPVAPADLGIYGPKTSAAVGQFQKANGIAPQAPDNIGPKTRKVLNAKFAV